jgi:hypothetical protein
MFFVQIFKHFKISLKLILKIKHMLPDAKDAHSNLNWDGYVEKGSRI